MDFDKEENDSALLPEGDYNAVLSDITMNASQYPRWVMLKWLIVKDSISEGLDIVQFFRFNEKSEKWCRWQLGLLGVWQQLKTVKEEWLMPPGLSDEQQIMELNNFACNKAFCILSKMVDKTEVTLKVTHDTYNGKTSDKAVIEELIEMTSESPSEPNPEPPTTDSNEEIPF